MQSRKDLRGANMTGNNPLGHLLANGCAVLSTMFVFTSGALAPANEISAEPAQNPVKEAVKEDGTTTPDPASAKQAPSNQAVAKAPTAEELELQEMMAIVKDFDRQTNTYKKEIQLIIERKYEEEKNAVISSYEHAISELETKEIKRRLDAIEVFERFLAKYPSDPSYTPGALWRLAELHYERAKYDLGQKEDNYEKQLADFNKGMLKEEPLAPVPHFERTVELLQRLISGFPSYKLSDGAHYLLAYCLQEQDEQAEAEAVWSSFVRRFPTSKLLPEVWTRLGELYFEDPDKLEEAIVAYQNVLKYPSSGMYDKSLYKLAWTYYKIDRFDKAVEEFDRLVTYADSDKEDPSKSDLRKEALQYLAISFAEDDWENSGVENAKRFFTQKKRNYDGEFFRELGNIYAIDTRYDKSVAAYEEAISRYPTHEGNPKLMASIIDNYYRLQQRENAAKAEERLVKEFGPNSPWWKANEKNPDVIQEASKLSENALYNSAVFHHMIAQRLKTQEQPEKARSQYAAAAAGYNEYINRFPQSRNSYELNYYLAECYYYSLQFDKAAVAYAGVRDSVESDKYLSESANSTVLSYLNMIKQAEESGQLKPLTIYTSKDRPKELPIAEREIPKLRQELVQACDVFVAKLPNDQQAGNMAFRAAQIKYAFDHFDDARKRFSNIVTKANSEDLASSSINLIIESYLVTQDWVQVENWSRKLAALTRDPELKKNLKTFELGARFNNASNLMSQGKTHYDNKQQEEANKFLDKSAAEFIRLVNDDPKSETSDKGLNNAALCYTWSNRPISAGKIYERIVKEYPKSEFADNALFLMAYSAESSYQYQRAIASYLKLVDSYKDSKYRADSLFNAAVALEGDQQYTRAAKSYERYAKLFRDRPDAAENYYRAGLMHEKQKDWKAVIKLYRQFIKAYRKNKDQHERVVEAMMKISRANAELGERKTALEGYDAVIKMYNSYKLPAGGRAADSAAEASFLLAERSLTWYEKITFDVPARKLKKTLGTKASSLKKMENRYKTVFQYKRVAWTLAAYYRLGYLYENFADVLTNAPCPKGFSSEECDIYKGKLEEFAEAPIKKAVAAYAETIEKAKEFKAVNDWTSKTLESLNRYEPIAISLAERAGGEHGPGLVCSPTTSARRGERNQTIWQIEPDERRKKRKSVENILARICWTHLALDRLRFVSRNQTCRRSANDRPRPG